MQITSRIDIEKYVTDEHSDLVSHGLCSAVVDAIQKSEHPDYGDDWSAWLSKHMPSIRVAVTDNLGDWNALGARTKYRLVPDGGARVSYAPPSPAETPNQALDREIAEELERQVRGQWQRQADWAGLRDGRLVSVWRRRA